MSTELAARNDVRALVDESTQILATAKGFKIATNVSYQLAGEELKRIKGAMKRLDDLRTSITRPMDAAKKAVMDLFRSPAERLEGVERAIKSAMVTYQNELDRQARQVREKAEREAREEQERLAVAAARAADRGDMERADALQTQAATVQPVVVTREAPKIAGVNMRDLWYAECVDLKALVTAVAAGRVPLSCVMANDKVLGAQARNLKRDFVADGVRVWSVQSVAAGSA